DFGSATTPGPQPCPSAELRRTPDLARSSVRGLPRGSWCVGESGFGCPTWEYLVRVPVACDGFPNSSDSRHVAQWDSTSLTRQGSAVQPRPCLPLGSRPRLSSPSLTHAFDAS